MPAYPPPPPPPSVKTKNVYIIAGAAVLITAIITTGVVVVNGQDDAGQANATSTSSPRPDEAITASPVVSVPPIGEEDKPDPVKLTDTVTYRNDVEVSLSGHRRGESGALASPPNTQFVRFRLKIANNSKKVADITGVQINCLYGDDVPGEEIRDHDLGLDGALEMRMRPRLRAGQTVSAVVACELPKSETHLRVEVVPGFLTDPAVFAGEVD
ncbi:hypothetical protein ACFPH6_07250 [Streptomyces xiangluensis]|uniref:DUF4352 domain-containing protein n=1 Tax=Streptomyces xiangluensis TaxID=2665720 RepID=A0ABV8YGD3_9ACTN